VRSVVLAVYQPTPHVSAGRPKQEEEKVGHSFLAGEGGVSLKSSKTENNGQANSGGRARYGKKWNVNQGGTETVKTHKQTVV